MAHQPKETDPREERVDQVIAAYLEEVDAGRSPDQQEWLARYPDLAAELQAFFADHDRMGRLTTPLRPGNAPHDPLGETVDATDAPASDAVSPLPASVGGYRPVRLLGTGGMGRVYEAEDASGRRVALKLISPGFADSPTAVERFRQEGRLASMIAHPHCVFVLTADEEAGQPYIVMELMSGATLKDLVDRRGPLAPADAITKILDVIEGLEEAHRSSVIHRDVKPANCYLDADGGVKIGDFGLSRSLGGSLHLTRTGGFVGTPLFASPEQLRGERLDQRTDIYSVAATLYYLLTGQAPFQHADGTALIARVVSEPAPPPRSLCADIPPVLEQVVLRGLERQRERRFQTLDEFREALLPLLPNQLTMAGLGLRTGAYFIDAIPIGFWGMAVEVAATRNALQISLPAYLLMTLPGVIYFFLTEGLWGCSLGKKLLRLRVARAADPEPPGWLRTLLRTAVFWATSGCLVGVCLYAVFDRNDRIPWAVWNVAGTVLSLAARFCTMRTRNGYRGLHEFLSNTRVVQLPPARMQALLARSASEGVPSLALRASKPEELPEQLGVFFIRGVVHGDDAERILLGEDATLGRRVWIRLRPAAEGPLPAARRELARSTRLRWLTGGEHAAWRWDAFVAPAGAPLTEVVAGQGPLDWRTTRRILEQLTDELEAARAEGTLPAVLTIDQVWLQRSGSVQLLDGPLSTSGEAETRNEEERGLALLRQAALLALEGRMRSDEEMRKPVAVPLPLYAQALLDRLSGRANSYECVAQVRADLTATRNRPAETSAVLRLLHLGLSLCLLTIGLANMVVWCRFAALIEIFWLDRKMTETQTLVFVLEDEGLHPALLAELPADHGLRTNTAVYPELLRRQMEQDHHKLLARLDALGPFGAPFDALPQVSIRKDANRHEETLRVTRRSEDAFVIHAKRLESIPADDGMVFRVEDFEKAAGRADGSNTAGPEDPEYILLTGLGTIAAFPLLWVIWAFIFRGGIGLRLAGLALVRSDGQIASRLRCAWRSLLVWLPLVGLFGLIVWIDFQGPEIGWLGSALQSLVVVLLAGYAALALLYPRRCLHDWLAGTYLVPR